jgi:hypothetical protein
MCATPTNATVIFLPSCAQAGSAATANAVMLARLINSRRVELEFMFKKEPSRRDSRV